jgi:hypothetical protein
VAVPPLSMGPDVVGRLPAAAGSVIAAGGHVLGIQCHNTHWVPVCIEKSNSKWRLPSAW